MFSCWRGGQIDPNKVLALPHGVAELPLHAVLVHAKVSPAGSSEQVVSLLLVVVSKLQLVGGFVVTWTLGRAPCQSF